ncbi:hypothetical protein [Symbioplanes lichenis]|uniref:hypothetical protein n=1 Tax=Symbioplanes lichenis TaxID=1629072 RepID=UPI002739EAD4|nr:hypothetical protein [Actinoplanes lichenis]
MAETRDAGRPGRRESTLSASLPGHRAAFATRLRELRRECGQPSYRRLSELAHCSFAALSAAAAGRRFPTWEMTRGYVTACLRHAGREADIATALPKWRRLWEDFEVREKAHRLEPSPPPVVSPAPGRLRLRLRSAVAGAVLLSLLVTMAAATAVPGRPAPMSGLFNIVVAPFEGFPPGAGGLERTLTGELERWARGDAAVQTRGPAGVDHVPGGDADDRDRALTRLAGLHHADVVVTGRLSAGRPQEDRDAAENRTVTIDIVLTDRVFAETPELAGRHELTLTEPADVLRGNIEVSRALATDAVRFVQAIVAFVRGLGRYALDRYAAAEQDFRQADTALSGLAAHAATPVPVVLLMLGNAVGRTGRFAEAADIFRRALDHDPGYTRAAVGLADAVRAGVPCDRNADLAPLRSALAHYAEALPRARTPLLTMKIRLGLGLSYQCLSLSGAAHWAQADEHFAAVLSLHRAGRMSGEAGRQAARLAAEARAAQALTAWRSGDLREAAASYEAALALLSTVGVTRPTIRDRERLFRKNLDDVRGPGPARSPAVPRTRPASPPPRERPAPGNVPSQPPTFVGGTPAPPGGPAPGPVTTGPAAPLPGTTGAGPEDQAPADQNEPSGGASPTSTPQ